MLPIKMLQEHIERALTRSFPEKNALGAANNNDPEKGETQNQSRIQENLFKDPRVNNNMSSVNLDQSIFCASDHTNNDDKQDYCSKLTAKEQPKISTHKSTSSQTIPEKIQSLRSENRRLDKMKWLLAFYAVKYTALAGGCEPGLFKNITGAIALLEALSAGAVPAVVNKNEKKIQSLLNYYK